MTSQDPHAGPAKGGPVINGDALRAARERLDWTVDDLAVISGVASTTLRRYEKPGPRRVQIDYLAALAAALAVPIASLTVEPPEPGLREYRYRAGLTVEQAAAALGCSMSLVSGAEVGLKLSGPLLQKMAATYGARESEIAAAFDRVRAARIRRARAR